MKEFTRAPKKLSRLKSRYLHRSQPLLILSILISVLGVLEKLELLCLLIEDPLAKERHPELVSKHGGDA